MILRVSVARIIPLRNVAGVLGSIFACTKRAVKRESEDGIAQPARWFVTETELRKACEAVWVAAQGYPWTTLAVVPSGAGQSVAAFALELATVGSEYYGRTVEFVDGTGLELHGARALVDRLSGATGLHSLVVALDDPLESQSALLAARTASRVVAGVALGHSRLSDMKRLVESVGQERFLGATVSGSPDGR